MSTKMKKIGIFLGSVLTCCFLFSSCNLNVSSQSEQSSSSVPQEEEGVELTQSDFLKAVGKDVKNKDGDTVYLRGVNAGGLFVIEQWMNGFKKSSSEESEITCIDHKTTTLTFAERFGQEKAQELWKIYQENWWSDADFENCVNMNMNVIRLPFTYMTVDPAATYDLNEGGKNYDFSALDAFVNKAASYGLYTILDLHGAYGSQNGQDHSGEVVSAAADIDFYANEQKMGLTVKLWKELATHFKNNPAVAGYDILNEPAEHLDGGGTQSTGPKHWNFFDRVYDAIREADTEHMVIFESCWEAENLPQPTDFGWENCMYSFHHYTGCTGQDRADEHNRSFDAKIASVNNANFNVPLQMGEFTCYENEKQWDYTLNLLNRNNWHWTSWTYKINNTWGNSGWGIVRVETKQDDKIDAHNDTYEVIVEKMKKLRTAANVAKCTFDQGRTLFDLVGTYCLEKPTQTVALPNANYIITSNATGQCVRFMENKGAYKVASLGEHDKIDGDMIMLTNHPSGDKTVYLSYEGTKFSTYDYENVPYLALSGASEEAMRFVPMTVDGEDGTVIMSYLTKKFIRIDRNGFLVADARLQDAERFTFNP